MSEKVPLTLTLSRDERFAYLSVQGRKIRYLGATVDEALGQIEEFSRTYPLIITVPTSDGNGALKQLRVERCILNGVETIAADVDGKETTKIMGGNWEEVITQAQAKFGDRRLQFVIEGAPQVIRSRRDTNVGGRQAS